MRRIEYSLKDFAYVEMKHREACKAHHKARAEAEVLKEMSKDKLASIMQRLSQPGEKVSAVELERKARCTEEWTTFREGQWAAMREEGETKASMVSAQTAWETIRSGISYKKQELKELPGA